MDKKMKPVTGASGLFKRGDHYHVDFQYHGRRYCRAAGTSLDGAKSLLLQIRTRARLESEGIRDNSFPLKDLYALYLEDRKLQLRASTLESYGYSFAQLWSFFTQPLVKDLRPEAVNEYIKARRKNGVAATTINREIALLKAVLRYGERMGHIANNPLRHVSGIAKPKTEYRRALQYQEFERLLDHHHAHGSKGSCPCRCKAYWVVLGETGLRLGELIHLEWSDVDLEHRTITVRGHGDWEPKTPAACRTIPMSNRVHEVFRERSKRSRDGPIFPEIQYNLRRRFMTCLAAAGIDRHGLTLHCLRHSFISWLLQRGVPPKTVQKLAGHSDISTTMNVYSHTMKGDEERAIALLNQPVPDARKGFQLGVAG